MEAAGRRLAFISDVMIAQDIKQWNIILLSQGGEILRGEIATAKYEINAFYCGSASLIIQ